jgi:ankyrin repeat protein
VEAEDRLFVAIEKDDAAALRELLKQDPKLASARSKTGISAVLTAAYHRKKAALEVLIGAKPQLDVFEAAALGDKARLEGMLKAKPKLVGDRSRDGFTALHLACFFKHLDTAEFLLDHGADPDAVADNPSGVTPLHSAAAARSHEIVGLLLDSGADPNAQQSGGFTALHAAAMHRDLDMVRTLLRFKAKGDLASDDGKTARSLAEGAGASEIVALITEHDAS